MVRPSLFAILTALLLAPLCQTSRAGDDLPAVESFFKDAEVPMVALSPKGHYVAILNNMGDGTQRLAVRDTSDLQKLTVPAGASKDDRITALHWINENRLGFTVKDLRIEFEGNWDEFAVDRDGSHLQHLISGNWRHYQNGTGSHIKNKVLTADYAFFDLTHDGSDDIIVEKFFFNQIDIHPQHSRLYRLDTKTLSLTDLLPGAQPEHSRGWLADASDAPRIATGQNKDHCFISYRAAGAADWSELENADCYHSKLFTPRFFDGADTLYVSADYQGNSALFRYDLKKRQLEKEPFVSLPGFDFMGAPEFDYASKKLLGIHVDADARTTVWLDARLKEMQKKIDALLPQTINTLTCAFDCLGSPVILVTSASDRQPTQYLMYTQASGAIVRIGASHPGIKPAQMGQRDFYHYAARDGLSIPVYVTTPPGKAQGPWPTVVLVHGGPGVRGSSWEWEQEAQFLATRGYLVIQPEYRGSTGFGSAHQQAGWKQWGQAMQDDLADAATWSVKKGWSDPQRIAIMGASY
ncbi:MAG TPA: prolyl oligopeptidase family serine peptidase, partial [Janthinobacterium sp.]|nr:prolyl oligopeptidase family serine peptidase [Janthinobacterium sp.]